MICYGFFNKSLSLYLKQIFSLFLFYRSIMGEIIDKKKPGMVFHYVGYIE